MTDGWFAVGWSVATRRRLLISLRAIAIGWGTLGLAAFLLEHPLLKLTGPILGAKWIATASLGLDCVALCATGWMVGRFSRPIPVAAVLVFAVTLMLGDLSPIVSIDIPWLIRLAGDTLSGGSAYLDSLLSTAPSQILLFGCLVAGGLLSRPSTKPASILEG